MVNTYVKREKDERVKVPDLLQCGNAILQIEIKYKLLLATTASG